ncbi:MAG: S8 family peptidase [Mobilitalea sp.]
MAGEKLPIKFFAKREMDEMFVEPAPRGDAPGWVLMGEELIKRVQLLEEDLEKIQNLFVRRISSESIIPVTIKARINGESTAKTHRKEITELFRNKGKNKVIGLSGTDELIIKIETKADIEAIAAKLKEYDTNSYAISCVKRMEEFQPHLDLKDGEEDYKVKLINFQEYEQNEAISRLFEKILRDRSIVAQKTLYANELSIYNLKKVDNATVDALRYEDIFEAVFSIEPMPRYFVGLDIIKEETELDIKLPEENEQYVTVGVLDSGIAQTPQLKPWVLRRESVYPDEYIDPSHGTFVSGIIVYGDECEREKWVGGKGIKLLDAAVFPIGDELEEDELVRNITEVIKRNSLEVKIWNLSISIQREIKNNDFSDFAIALDSIQDKYDVMICKSAGNCKNFMQGKGKGKIHEGADSVRSLVVGSIAHEKGTYDQAVIDNPSPFTRVGPGPSYIIKPEVVHYGGNAGVDAVGRIKTTGVKSLSPDGSIVSAVGTSFSTPRVVALAAGLYQEMAEEFDSLLLKSLIIHSASYSENLLLPSNERTKQIGFGKPKRINEILYNSPNEATLILRDSLATKEFIDILDFPMPDCLIKDGYYTGQIIATIVYDPILDSTQMGEYCQSDIEFKFGSYDTKIERDTEKRMILNPVGRQGSQNILLDRLYSKKKMITGTDDFALKERLRIQYGDKFYPVKKFAVNLEELTEGNKIKYLGAEKSWYLNIKGLFRNHIIQKASEEYMPLSQEFCLILTIRDPTGTMQVYDSVTQKLNEHNFWHSNIKVHSEVEVNI